MIAITPVQKVKKEAVNDDDVQPKGKGGRKSSATTEAVPADLMPHFGRAFIPTFLHRISLLTNPFKLGSRSDQTVCTIIKEIYDQLVPSNGYPVTKNCGLYRKVILIYFRSC